MKPLISVALSLSVLTMTLMLPGRVQLLILAGNVATNEVAIVSKEYIYLSKFKRKKEMVERSSYRTKAARSFIVVSLITWVLTVVVIQTLPQSPLDSSHRQSRFNIDRNSGLPFPYLFFLCRFSQFLINLLMATDESPALMAAAMLVALQQ